MEAHEREREIITHMHTIYISVIIFTFPMTPPSLFLFIHEHTFVRNNITEKSDTRASTVTGSGSYTDDDDDDNDGGDDDDDDDDGYYYLYWSYCTFFMCHTRVTIMLLCEPASRHIISNSEGRLELGYA